MSDDARRDAINRFNARRAAVEAQAFGIREHAPDPMPPIEQPPVHEPLKLTGKAALASALAKRGFRVFPIREGAKFPPLARDWPAKATIDLEMVRAFWTVNPDANAGIHCAGMAVLDMDARNGGEASLSYLVDVLGLDAGTLTTMTPGGGRHLFYRLPEGHPGVPNSVSKLAPGIDVKSTAGYVVAPGSTTEAGTYKFVADVPILPAPEWLLEILGTRQERDTAARVQDVEDADEATLGRARSWLSGTPADAGGFWLACGLKDYGLSQRQIAEVLAGGEAPAGVWPVDQAEQKARNAFAHGQEAPGVKALGEDDFAPPTGLPVNKPFGVLPDGVPPYTGPPGSTKRHTGPQSLAALAEDATPGAGYLVKGLLNRGSYAVMSGLPGEGKSFVALDLGRAVATGSEWMGRRTHAGPVLYLAFEGRGGMRGRVRALARQYGDLSGVPMYVDGTNYNLRDKAGRAALGEAIQGLPQKPVLIVIDTFAHALCGGDENSTQDVSAFNAGVETLIQFTGACVLVIHHPPKGGERTRGSSALPGAIDTEIWIANRIIKPMKQRDIEPGEPLGFRLAPVVIGTDEDGDDVTSCVVLQANLPRLGDRRIKKGSKADVAFQILVELRPDNSPITETEWRQNCDSFIGSRRQAWAEALLTLKRAKMVTLLEDGRYTRRLE